MGKFRKINRKRKSIQQASTTKLSNKKTNKLIKRGKVKPKSNYRSAYRRSRETSQLEKKDETRNEIGKKNIINDSDVDVDDIMDMVDNEALPITQKFRAKMGDDVAETTDDEEVEEYERLPRSSFLSENKMHHLLPIKSGYSIIPQSVPLEEDCSDDSFSAVANIKEASLPSAEAKYPTTFVELYARRQERVAEVKNKTGTACYLVVSNPEEHITKLKDVVLLLDNSQPGIFLRIRKMAALSLLEVFRDIIPSYRIRQDGGSDKTKKVKKETKKLHDYEDALLRYYKKYLVSLEKMTQVPKKQPVQPNDSNQKAKQNLASFAMMCFTELLLRHPHFNFRNNIIKIVVNSMLSKEGSVADLCCATLSRLFREDKVGEVSLETVKQMKQLVKSRCYNVPPPVLYTFLSLNVKEATVDSEKNSKKDMKKIRQRIMKMSRKERKRNKKMQELEKELLETEAEESKQKKSRYHTEILENVFYIYFHILKTTGNSKSVLLTPVLEGLSKFAHLINIDFFDDVISLLNHLIESGNLSVHEIIHCLKTVFTILSGQGASLQIDHRGFYNHLYQILLRSPTSVVSDDLETLLQCLDVMITKRRKQVTVQRVLAFIKRLCTVSLQSTPCFALALLSAVRTYFHHHKQSDTLLDTENLGSGLFLPELGDPEHCNAIATSLWELHYLVRHYHPVVCKFANHILLGCPAQGQGLLQPELSQKSPVELCAMYDDTEEFNPPLQPLKSHRKSQVAKRIPDCILSSESVTSQAIKHL